MIIKVPSEQITQAWDVLKKQILEGSLRPNDEAYATFILQRFLEGKIDLWIVYDVERIVGIMTTAFVLNPWGEFELSILSLKGMGVREAIYQDLVSSLKKFSAENGIARIVAISDANRIVEIAKKLGAKTRTELVFEVNE